MGRGISGAILTAMGARAHTATVTATAQIAPHMRAVDFRCPGLLTGQEGPGAYVRGWFPDPGGSSTLHQRGYTLMGADAEAGTFRIAFLLHEPAGPASAWAARCSVGDELQVQHLASEVGYDLSAHPGRGYLLLGDAASWPALAAIVAEVPDDIPVTVVFEVAHDEDRELPFPAHPRLELIWAPALPDSRTLVDSLSGRDFDGWQTWVTGESKATRLARSSLQIDHGQNKATMHAQDYWVAGREMGKEVEVGRAAPDAPSGSATTAGAVASAADDAVPAEPPDVLAPARPVLVAAGIVQAVLSVLQVVPLVLLAEVARGLASGASSDDLRRLAVQAIVVLALGVVGTSALLLGLHLHDALFAAALRRRILDKLGRVPLGWFRSRSTAEVARLVKTDVGALHYLVTHSVTDLVGAVVTPLTILVYLFTVQWRLGLVVLVPVVVYLVVMIRMAAADRPRLTTWMRYSATLPGLTDRFTTGQPESRVFGDGATVDLPGILGEVGDFVTSWQGETIGAKAATLRLNRPVTVMVLLSVAGLVAVQAGWMPAVDLLVFLVLGTSVGERLVAISYAANGLRDGLRARSDLQLLFTTAELRELPEDPGSASGSDSSGPASLRFRGVTFGYAPGRPVLQDLDLDLVPGGVTALVGPSGAGKSTIAALAGRLWDPDVGSVTLDGVDLRTLDEAALRQRVALVLQDVQLVRGTLRENLTLGHPDTTDAELAEVLTAVHLDDVVAALPGGLDAVVDRDSMSGGQRQRVGIARALLGSPEVVVLDEATASADPDSEWAIQQGLTRLLAGRTVLIVSHRLHTVVHADQIVVVDGGRIVEQGRHDALLRVDGLYARMTAETMEVVR